jgi:hypothetical protein
MVSVAVFRQISHREGRTRMERSMIWPLVSWISLPTVMFGGYSLLRLLNAGNKLTPFQATWFRAGHAHAGVLLVMSLAYYDYLDRTMLGAGTKNIASAVLTAGILAQSGGFFLHMIVGQPNQRSAGTTVTITGALLLTTAIAVLVYGMLTT